MLLGLNVEPAAHQINFYMLAVYTPNAFPEIFSNYFSKCRFIHNYNTRQALDKNFFLARKQKSMGQRSLQYRGTKL